MYMFYSYSIFYVSFLFPLLYPFNSSIILFEKIDVLWAEGPEQAGTQSALIPWGNGTADVPPKPGSTLHGAPYYRTLGNKRTGTWNKPWH